MKTKGSRSSHPLVAFIILAIIAGLVTINLWLYFWSQKELAPSKNQPVTTTTDPLADWQTYTNRQYGFNIKYPSNWVAKEIPNQEYDGVVNFFQSETKTYPELGGSQPIGENVVTLSLLKNPTAPATDKELRNTKNSTNNAVLFPFMRDIIGVFLPYTRLLCLVICFVLFFV
jgi:cell division protein FtsN